MLLIQIGLGVNVTNWIMACISTPSFVALINEFTSQFFSYSKALRQGCPLSSPLFLLVMEGLNRLITQEKREGRIKGIKVVVNLVISHMLFVDDVLILGDGSLAEWNSFINIIDTFFLETNMEVSLDKSSFLHDRIEASILNDIKNIWHCRIKPLNTVFKYLELWLKPNNYMKEDWLRMTKKR